MHPAVSADNIAHLSYFQPKCRILKWFLHLSWSKGTQIPSFGVRRAIGMDARKLREVVMRFIDFRLVISENTNSFLLRACNGRLDGVSQNTCYNSLITSFQLEGRLLSLCFTKMWLARTC